MAKSFKGKIVVITGATAGIGLAAAAMFEERGAHVICVARHESDRFESVCADISDGEQVKRAAERIIAKHGGIDILVNNAGGGISGTIEDSDPEDVKRLFDVNFFGALNFIREVLPSMRERGGGTIINVSSVAAQLAIPFQSFYSASKAALSSLSSALRNEVAPFNIKVCSVLPGDVKTQFTSSRKKSLSTNPAYGDRAGRAVATMERDEQGGMPPEVVARAICRLAASKRPPVYGVVGAKYKLVVALSKRLGSRPVNFILGKLYG